jgi:hypothetical protein
VTDANGEPRWKSEVERRQQRKARELAARLQLAEARAAGLVLRHRLKLRRGRRAGDTTSKENR